MRVIVLGAGIFGASAAYHLAAAGAEVTMVDALRTGRATEAGAGIICPWSSRAADPDWYRLASAAARHYPALVAELAALGETDLGYCRVGALCVAGDEGNLEQAWPRISARIADAPEAGRLRHLSAKEAGALFPPLHPDSEALHIEGAARVDGRRLAAALRRAAIHHGAKLHQGEATEVLTEGGRVTGIRMAGEDIGADSVLVTAGAWAPQLLAPLGVQLPIQPQRGQILHLRLAGQPTEDWPVLLPMSSHYLLAFEEGRVVVGATRETGSGFDPRLTAGGVMQVLRQALGVAPGLAAAELIELRVGLRPMGPDIRPLLGGVAGIEGLFIGNGLGAGGLTMGPLAGKLLAQAALHTATELDLAPYAPLRD
jgi:D-amino-acid dehydrogenase